MRPVIYCDLFRSDYLRGRMRSVKCRTHSANSNSYDS
jgi:hypothetical protein